MQFLRFLARWWVPTYPQGYVDVGLRAGIAPSGLQSRSRRRRYAKIARSSRDGGVQKMRIGPPGRYSPPFPACPGKMARSTRLGIPAAPCPPPGRCPSTFHCTFRSPWLVQLQGQVPLSQAGRMIVESLETGPVGFPTGPVLCCCYRLARAPQSAAPVMLSPSAGSTATWGASKEGCRPTCTWWP